MSILFDVIRFITHVEPAFLNQSERNIATMLASMIGNKNEEGWVIRRSILAYKCGLSIKHLTLNLKRLRAKKILIVEKIVTGKGKLNKYKINAETVTTGIINAADFSKEKLPTPDLPPTLGTETTPKYEGTLGVETSPTLRCRNVTIGGNDTINTKETLLKNKKEKYKKEKVFNEIELPDWLPKDKWDEFVNFRKEIKKPMTPHAQRLGIKELSKLRDKNNDIEDVIDQSIFKGYTGLFPIKEDCHRSIVNKKIELTPYQQQIRNQQNAWTYLTTGVYPSNEH